MRISDWSSDVCSSDLAGPPPLRQFLGEARFLAEGWTGRNRRYGLEGREGARGRTVLVIPGLLAADWMTRPLRRALASAGHEVPGWALGWNRGQIGRASSRERVCQYAYISVVAGSLKQKTHT